MDADCISKKIFDSLEEGLNNFAKEISIKYPFIEYKIERRSREYFVLIVYLQFKRQYDTQGDAVDICVDVQLEGRRLSVSSDACYDSGPIIADGPGFERVLSDSFDKNRDLAGWPDEFARFLAEVREPVSAAVSRL